jgi:senataxin
MLPETKGSAGFASYRSALKASILSLSRALRTQRSALSSALVAVGDAGRESALQSLCVEHTAALITAILSPEQDVHRAALNVVRATFDEASTRADCFMALLRSSPARALEGLQDYLTRFVAALSLLVEANEAARWMVRSFTDIIDALCSPLEGLLRNGTPHSYLDSSAARDAIGRHVPSIWTLMCQSIASIFKHTPSWSRVLAQEELVAWFRDVLLFACDTVEHAATIRAAVESLPEHDDDEEDFIFAALAFPLEEACNW